RNLPRASITRASAGSDVALTLAIRPSTIRTVWSGCDGVLFTGSITVTWARAIGSAVAGVAGVAAKQSPTRINLRQRFSLTNISYSMVVPQASPATALSGAPRDYFGRWRRKQDLNPTLTATAAQGAPYRMARHRSFGDRRIAATTQVTGTGDRGNSQVHHSGIQPKRLTNHAALSPALSLPLDAASCHLG